MLAGRPTRSIEIPEFVAVIADGRRIRTVWENSLGGLTFEIASSAERCFVKWAPTGCGIDLSKEVVRLEWAVQYHRVPRVLGWSAQPAGTWLQTSALKGESAVSERWVRSPQIAVKALGEGLRALHDALPIDRCPFQWSAEQRVDAARRVDARAAVGGARWQQEFGDLSLDEALAEISQVPSIAKAVVCHGDACAPNTLLGPDGRWSGHVDLGALGTADRWADLAIATWSCDWNFGPGWQQQLLDGYGIDPDPERIRYYRLLWEVGS